ncbi:MAG: hypothetical protein QM778_18420 [Myxococcales bacterium]
MHELFRYMSMRPPVQPDDDAVVLLQPSQPLRAKLVAARSDSRAAVHKVASEHLQSSAAALSVDRLESGRVLEPLAKQFIEAGQLRAQEQLEADLKKALGDQWSTHVTAPGFALEQQRLADTLIAAKLCSTGSLCDLDLLTALACIYEAAARLAAGGTAHVPSIAVIGDLAAAATPSSPTRAQEESAVPPAPKPELVSLERDANDLQTALDRLGNLPLPDLVKLPHRQLKAQSAVTSEPGCRTSPESTAPVLDVQRAAVDASTPWEVRSEFIDDLPRYAATLARKSLADSSRGDVASLAELLQREQATVQAKIRSLRGDDPMAEAVVSLGNKFFKAGTLGKTRAPKTSGLPQGSGSLRPVGVADLLVVRQQLTSYQGGDVAHIENILKSEELHRETERREKSEQSVLTETDELREEERDTQTTERFSLQRETATTLETDLSVNAGLAVTARYGTMVEVQANAGFSYQTSSSDSVRQSSAYGKDVVTRAATKVSRRMRELRTTTTSIEFLERNKHGFQNSAPGATHISGVYQWVDKVSEAQVYNYGKRMMFDVMLPEPAAFFVAAQQQQRTEGDKLVKPPTFTAKPSDITESNYQSLAQSYDAIGIEPPPPLYLLLAKAIEFNTNGAQGATYVTKADAIPVTEGYEAIGWAIRCLSGGAGSNNAYVFVGREAFDSNARQATSWTLAGETSQVPIAVAGLNLLLFAATIEVLIRRTERAMAVWRQKTHAAIAQAYTAKKAEYERALASAAAGSTVQISGRNPGANKRLVRTELRKMCLAQLTAQQFDAFGAIETSSQGYPEANLVQSELQGEYIRFFEQAFEWDQLMYFFYPYYWGIKEGWLTTSLLEDVDPEFGDFLRAGEARAVFPVRPGFEKAVLHYLDTGEIWNGGNPPKITSRMYVPILAELEAANGPAAAEKAHGDPWEVRLPTTLVHLRADDRLPKWKKTNGVWGEDLT